MKEKIINKINQCYKEQIGGTKPKITTKEGCDGYRYFTIENDMFVVEYDYYMDARLIKIKCQMGGWYIEKILNFIKSLSK